MAASKHAVRLDQLSLNDLIQRMATLVINPFPLYNLVSDDRMEEVGKNVKYAVEDSYELYRCFVAALCQVCGSAHAAREKILALCPTDALLGMDIDVFVNTLDSVGVSFDAILCVRQLLRGVKHNLKVVSTVIVCLAFNGYIGEGTVIRGDLREKSCKLFARVLKDVTDKRVDDGLPPCSTLGGPDGLARAPSRLFRIPHLTAYRPYASDKLNLLKTLWADLSVEERNEEEDLSTIMARMGYVRKHATDASVSSHGRSPAKVAFSSGLVGESRHTDAAQAPPRSMPRPKRSCLRQTRDASGASNGYSPAMETEADLDVFQPEDEVLPEAGPSGSSLGRLPLPDFMTPEKSNRAKRTPKRSEVVALLKGQKSADVFGHLSDRKRLEFSCALCEKVFHFDHLMRHHLEEHPGLTITIHERKGGETRYTINSTQLDRQCGLCLQTLYSHRNLLSHLYRKHLKESNFPCPICDDGSTHKNNLKIHLVKVHKLTSAEAAARAEGVVGSTPKKVEPPAPRWKTGRRQ